MIQLFELNNINNSPASFNQEKLEWINQSHIKTSEVEVLVSNLKWHLDQLNIEINNGPNINEVVDALRDRSKSLVDMAQSCTMFYNDFKEFDSIQADKVFTKESKLVLVDLLTNLNDVRSWTAANIHSVNKGISESRNIGFGKVGQPFRLAISGDGKAGSVDISAQLVGKEKTLLRIKMAIDYIDNINS
jgi:glutamyl-tRNA synthetase